MKDYTHKPAYSKPTVAQQSVDMGNKDRQQQALQQEKLNEERKKKYEEIYMSEYMERQKQQKLEGVMGSKIKNDNQN